MIVQNVLNFNFVLGCIYITWTQPSFLSETEKSLGVAVTNIEGLFIDNKNQ